MKIQLNVPEWGDKIYYIDINSKEKKIDIKQGNFVGVLISFNECVYEIVDSYDQKKHAVMRDWCSKSLKTVTLIANNMLLAINANNGWEALEDL